MSYRKFVLAFVPSVFTIASFSGCGGKEAEIAKPAEVTDEMLKQAEASDKYFSDQSKPKAKSN